MSFCFWLCSDANITWTQVTVWGYSEVISERQQLSSLVFEIVDKFGIFSILPCQSFLHTNTYIIYCIFDYVSISICVFNIFWCSLKCVQKLHLQLKHRCVDGLCSMAFKTTNDGVEDFLSDCHLLGVVVSSSLKEWVNHVSLYSTSNQNQNERQMEWQNYVVFKVIVLYAVMNRSKNAICTVQCCLCTAYRLGVCRLLWCVWYWNVIYWEEVGLKNSWCFCCFRS